MPYFFDEITQLSVGIVPFFHGIACNFRTPWKTSTLATSL